MSSSDYGLRRGKIFPASAAHHLLNPLRRIVQPPQRVVRRMNLTRASRVLEVGCGPGWFSPALAAAIPDGGLIICDRQQDMLDQALARLAGFNNVTSLLADATSIPLGESSIDAILVSSVLGEIPNPVQFFRECARLLSEDGRLTILETRRDSDFVRLGELVELASSCNFHLDERFGNRWEYTAVFRKSDSSDLPSMQLG